MIFNYCTVYPFKFLNLFLKNYQSDLNLPHDLGLLGSFDDISFKTFKTISSQISFQNE